MFVTWRRILDHFIAFYCPHLEIFWGLNWSKWLHVNYVNDSNIRVSCTLVIYSTGLWDRNGIQHMNIVTVQVQMLTKDTQRWYFTWPLSFLSRWLVAAWKKESNLSIPVILAWFLARPSVCKGHCKRTSAYPNIVKMFKWKSLCEQSLSYQNTAYLLTHISLLTRCLLYLSL